MATKRNPITFQLSDENFARIKEIFPEATGAENNLVALMDAFQAEPPTLKTDPENETNKELIERLCDKFGVSKLTLLDVIVSLQNELSQSKTEIQQLEETLQQQEVVLEEINKQNNEFLQTINELRENANNISWAKMRTLINPFPLRLIELTAERLSERYNKEVNPLQIMIDMVTRYTVEQQSEWFYPFVLRNREILQIAQEINPEIQSMNDIKKLWR